MSYDTEHLYQLLPAVLRARDSEQGGALRALIEVFAEQLAVLEENLDQLYDDLFIETCAPWVVPYIGELVGARAVYNLDGAAIGDAIRLAIRERAQVANTIAYRRRKGTAAALEQIAADVAGLPARAVEFFPLLATTQFLNHLRPDATATADVRRMPPDGATGGPFDGLARSADMRSIERGRGRHNIANVGLFIWRIAAYPLRDSPAAPVDARRFTFSPLGNSAPLFSRPQPEASIAGLAAPRNLPLPLSRRAMAAALDEQYSPDGSLLISVGGVAVPREQIRVCDLRDTGAPGGTWAHMPDVGVAIDPELGRIAFATAPEGSVTVSFHYGFGHDIGGGAYDRSATIAGPAARRLPEGTRTIAAAVAALPTPPPDAPPAAVEFTDSGRYAETPNLRLSAGKRAELRAAEGRRPTIVLGGTMVITGDAGTEMTLSGLLITGGAIRVPPTIGARPNRLRRLHLRDCTLVPGLAFGPDGAPRSPGAPSVIVEAAQVELIIERSIVGGVRANATGAVRLVSSVIDAAGQSEVAFAALDGQGAGAPLTLDRCTVVGKLHAARLEASNSIVLARLGAGDSWVAPVLVEQRQQGCARFCYLPPEAQAPRRHRCLPTSSADDARQRPQFTSLRYGDPGYAQLSRRCAPEVYGGADDGAEMGAFHDLYEPQRETNLRIRLAEHLPFGLEIGVIFVS